MRKIFCWLLVAILLAPVCVFLVGCDDGVQAEMVTEETSCTTTPSETIVESTATTEETVIETTEPTEPTIVTEPAEVTTPAESVEPTVATEPIQTEPPVQVKQSSDKYADDGSYPGFYGRLYIPDAGIDVALYRGYAQSITDRKDSANIFSLYNYSGEVIADHNNQDFSKLFNVSVGMTGYIQTADGVIINIVCVAVFNGHNTGDTLTNDDGENVIGQAAYTMYTCRNGWQNVIICLWDKT